MTDRHAGYVVTLESDLREDDAEATVTALRQIKNVARVEPVTASPELHIAESRARYALAHRFADFYREVLG